MVLKKIMKLREEFKGKFKMFIGNGVDTSLWLDDWHPFVPFIEKYGERIFHYESLGK